MKLVKRAPAAASGADVGVYISPFEQFLNEYKAAHPDVDRQQIDGRALLWDKVSMADQAADEPYGKSRLTQPGYVYYSDVD
ncbi:DUF3460 family protein [Burkholderia dolosa]|jgi:hypothetical protein|uniref:DUF3460 family protein n=1 Tax=Burkholderia dolosa TaxID=152500 RepID=UPI001B965228|nr:DUF3460 family protein [Burkholderia dolosa]MBR8060823.1 DUF3460 family protein [Burkholderia dolosa]